MFQNLLGSHCVLVKHFLEGKIFFGDQERASLAIFLKLTRLEEPCRAW